MGFRAFRLSGIILLAALAVAGEARTAWSYALTLTRTDAGLELAGAVPDEGSRAAIVSAAAQSFPGLPLRIALTEQADAPPGFVEAARHALGLLALFAEGEARLSDRAVSFSGATFHPAALRDFEAGLGAGWPEGYAAAAGAVEAGPPGPPLDAAECEHALEEAAADGIIEFEAGSADIRAESRPLIDRIAYAALRCPDALVAVAGHTDADGTEEKNLRLSLDRARTVIDLLVADGLPAGRFTALGYGESRPLASNATDAGKALNRRIEFVLRD